MSRTKTIRIRLTESEQRRLKSLAGRRGISALVRASAFGQDSREQVSEYLTLISELARIRNALVLLAQSSDRRPPIEALVIVSQLVALERGLPKVEPK